MKKNVLFALNDMSEYRSLKDRLIQRGFTVIESKSGSDALEKILLERPSLILMEGEIPIIEGFKLFEILKTNPRTREIPVIFIHRERVELTYFNIELDQYILKPFHEDEIIRKIELVFLSKESMIYEKGEVEGSLTHISLADLLQILSMNRRDGIIILSDEEKRGEIYLVKGNIINATVGGLEGEKALFRLLQWKKGKFRFTSGSAISPVRITKPTYNVLMEGMRQMDEIARIIKLVPDEDELLIVDQERIQQLFRREGVYKELAFIFDIYRRVSDVVENCSYPDYEVYIALLELIREGIVTTKKVSEEVAIQEKEIFGEELMELIRILSSSGMTSGRVFFLLKRWEECEQLISTLTSLPGFQIDQQIVENTSRALIPLRLGRLDFPGYMVIDFFATEVRTLYLPIWGILLNRSLILVGIVAGRDCEEDNEIKNARRYLNYHLKSTVESFIIEGGFCERLITALKNALKKMTMQDQLRGGS